MSSTPSVITQFIQYYTDMDSEPLSILADLYHPDAVLTDPFGQHQGLPDIQRYFAQLLANVGHCRFAVDSPLVQGQQFAVSWVMDFSHPRLSGGKTLQLPGCSMVHIQDQMIIRQRDYYDAGEMLYEHLPVLGWAIRNVKKRVAS